MARLSFSKLSGSGNDFILLDNRGAQLSTEALTRTARALCRRKFSVGADGLIAIEASDRADFRWQFFNSDGSVAEMCGNGGRCAARYAVERGIAGNTLLCFETLAGIIRAEVRGRKVKLELPPPVEVRPRVEIPVAAEVLEAGFLNSGVPHVVVPVSDLESVDTSGLGRQIRFHTLFKPKGTNVNFIARSGAAGIAIRTYERGVEDETLACGTGAVASACYAGLSWGMPSPVQVSTRGGEELTVYFSMSGARFERVFLEGDTTWVYDGECTAEALPGA